MDGIDKLSNCMYKVSMYCNGHNNFYFLLAKQGGVKNILLLRAKKNERSWFGTEFRLNKRGNMVIHRQAGTVDDIPNVINKMQMSIFSV